MGDLIAAFPEKIKRATSPAEVAKQAVSADADAPSQKLRLTTTDNPYIHGAEGRHVHAVYLDEKIGVATVDLSRHTIIDCSTIDTTTNLEVRECLQSRSPGVRLYDAPVTGGVLGAEKSTLAFFLGCSESDPAFDGVTQLLSIIGRKVISCGGPSLGLVTKLTNNYLSGLIVIASSEAMNMGIRSGMDPIVLAQALAAVIA